MHSERIRAPKRALDGRRLVRLALLAQFVAISYIIPGPILLFIGPLFLYTLALVFLGKKSTLFLIGIDFMIDAPQYLIRFGGSSVSIAQVTAQAFRSSNGNPLSDFFATLPLWENLMILLLTLSVQIFLVRHVFFQSYGIAKRIRGRVPRHLWP